MNNELLTKSRSSEYHAAGYTGIRAHVVILDGNTDGHIHGVTEVVRVFAPDAKIVSFRFTTSAGKAAAYEYIERNKANIDVINASLGGNSIQARSFEPLEQYDIPVIAAAGNDSDYDNISYPARFPWTIAIGAYVNNLGHTATYSNRGNALDAISFTNVRIINLLGNAQTFRGTSCAAPTVTGLLALVADYRKSRGIPRMNTEDARKFIHDNCIDKYEEGFDTRSGHGLFVLPEITKLAASEAPKEAEPIENNTNGWIIVKDGKFVEARLIDGHTYVPVRDFAETMGLRLFVDNQNKIVTLKDV